MRAYFYWVKVRRYSDVPYYDQVIPDNDMSMLRKQRDDRGFVMEKFIQQHVPRCRGAKEEEIA